MPAKRRPPDSPQEWLNRAKSNLAIAKANVGKDVYLEDLCFDAQQAAEKATKAVLLSMGVDFPPIHNLTGLLSLIERKGKPIPMLIKKAGSLSRFAVLSRYPSTAEPVTKKEHKTAVSTAEAVIKWAEKQID